MSDLLHNPERWRERAEEARRIAERLVDAEAKRTMQGIAASYDRLVERARKRLDESPGKT